jgi:hypothetical protein
MARPSKLTTATAHTAQTLARLGFTDERVAAALNVSRSTLAAWKSGDPEFRDALKAAKATADAAVADGLFRRACGFTADDGTYFPPHPVAAIFWLKNRAGADWRDIQRQELSGPDGGPIQAAAPMIQLSREQDDALARVIADAQARVRLPTFSHIP